MECFNQDLWCPLCSILLLAQCPNIFFQDKKLIYPLKGMLAIPSWCSRLYYPDRGAMCQMPSSSVNWTTVHKYICSWENFKQVSISITNGLYLYLKVNTPAGDLVCRWGSWCRWPPVSAVRLRRWPGSCCYRTAWWAGGGGDVCCAQTPLDGSDPCLKERNRPVSVFQHTVNSKTSHC